MPPSFPRQNQAVVLRDTGPSPAGLRLRGYHPLRRGIPAHFGFPGEGAAGPCNTTSPTGFPVGFGLGSPPFGRPYSGDPYWFLLLPLLRCFRSGGSHSGEIPRALRVIHPQQEVPFGDPRFHGCVRLPGAYRRLPRPSSAPEPSHPPGGLVRCAAGVPVPVSVATPLHGAHRGISIKPLAPFAQKAWPSGLHLQKIEARRTFASPPS